MPESPQAIVTLIAGPTAAGKSAYAEALAQDRNGVIINADSLQIYKDLPLLTAMPNAATRAALPHALYGILPPDHPCNAHDWVHRTVSEIQRALQNGQHPIIVGGTGLYLKALTKGFSPLPIIPDNVRQATRDLHAHLGNPAFHRQLEQIDPLMAARLKKNDSQRLMRAYEVMTATGKSLADWQALPPVPPLASVRFEMLLVTGPRALLRERALKRLKLMIQAGVLDEIAAFDARIRSGELPPDCPPTRALGFFPFCAYLEGQINQETALSHAHTETCQYIKRQQTWFRHQMIFDKVIEIEKIGL